MTHVVLRRSGGFAGLTKEVDSDSLPPSEREEVERLAQNAPLDRLAAAAQDAPGRPDRFVYQLEVDGRTLTFPEHAVPDELRPLVDRLAPALRMR